MGRSFPHYASVPKDYAENLDYRLSVRQALKNAKGDELQRRYVQRCTEDVLFYINTFVMVYDPRLSPAYSVGPFNTYTFQDDYIADVVDAIETGHDLVTLKSRDQGGSWCWIAVFDQSIVNNVRCAPDSTAAVAINAGFSPVGSQTATRSPAATIALTCRSSW